MSASDKVTSEATYENVNATANTSLINTILSDTPAVCATDVAASNIIPTTSLTLEPFVSSTPLMITSHESVPPPTSVSNSHTSVSYVHSLGPPLLVHMSTQHCFFNCQHKAMEP